MRRLRRSIANAIAFAGVQLLQLAVWIDADSFSEGPCQ
jgi:hypothetical protein